MSIYFLDSSALVKRYASEKGTSWLQGLLEPSNGHSIIISRLTQAEIMSAVSRQKREGAVSLQAAQAIRGLLDRHAWREYTIIEVMQQIIYRAEDLLEKHPLRAYDAVQLASALESNIRLTAMGLSSLTFIAADQRLLSVAVIEGLMTDDPNTHP